MTTRTATRVLVRVAALALAVTGVTAADSALSAAPAEAAGCSYSNIDSVKVWNIDCYRGAYGYKASATATTGTRTGNWVAKQNWSYNGTPVCYQYPTMIKM